MGEPTPRPPLVSRERDPRGIVVLRMDDPEHKNGMSEAFCDELSLALSDLARDPSVKVLVLRGRADVFSSGATASLLAGLSAGNLDVKDLELPARLLGLPMPVITAVEGSAVGGGLVLAILGDVSVAAEEARYGFNFTDLGFTPGMGSTRLVPALVGHSFASEMLLTGKLYRGRELRGRGLFTHLVPAAEVVPRALELAERMADKPIGVLRLLKQTLAAPRLEALAAALAREHLLHRLCFADPATARSIEERYPGGMAERASDRQR